MQEEAYSAWNREVVGSNPAYLTVGIKSSWSFPSSPPMPRSFNGQDARLSIWQ